MRKSTRVSDKINDGYIPFSSSCSRSFMLHMHTYCHTGTGRGLVRSNTCFCPDLKPFWGFSQVNRAIRLLGWHKMRLEWLTNTHNGFDSDTTVKLDQQPVRLVSYLLDWGIWCKVNMCGCNNAAWPPFHQLLICLHCHWFWCRPSWTCSSHLICMSPKHTSRTYKYFEGRCPRVHSTPDSEPRLHVHFSLQCLASSSSSIFHVLSCFQLKSDSKSSAHIVKIPNTPPSTLVFSSHFF